MRFTVGRNQIGLTERQIAYCIEVWAVLCADRPIAFDTSEAVQYASRTRFDEAQTRCLGMGLTRTLGCPCWPVWRMS
jgi:hypothetical protein